MCDPMWHVSSRSGVVTLRTAMHLLLTYLLFFAVMGRIQDTVVSKSRCKAYAGCVGRTLDSFRCQVKR